MSCICDALTSETTSLVLSRRLDRRDSDRVAPITAGVFVVIPAIVLLLWDRVQIVSSSLPLDMWKRSNFYQIRLRSTEARALREGSPHLSDDEHLPWRTSTRRECRESPMKESDCGEVERETKALCLRFTVAIQFNSLFHRSSRNTASQERRISCPINNGI